MAIKYPTTALIGQTNSVLVTHHTRIFPRVQALARKTWERPASLLRIGLWMRSDMHWMMGSHNNNTERGEVNTPILLRRQLQQQHGIWESKTICHQWAKFIERARDEEVRREILELPLIRPWV